MTHSAKEAKQKKSSREEEIGRYSKNARGRQYRGGGGVIIK